MTALGEVTNIIAHSFKYCNSNNDQLLSVYSTHNKHWRSHTRNHIALQ